MPWFDIDACRAEVAKKYDSPNWRAKVKRMPDNQVIAIYNRMFIDKPKQKTYSEMLNTYKTDEKQTVVCETERVDPEVVEEDYSCEQLAFDL